MKTLFTRLLLPAAALLGLSSCMDPYMAYGPGGYSSYGGNRGYASAPLSYRSNYYSPGRSYYSSRSYPSSRSYYGSPYRSYSGYSSAYQPVGFPGLGLFGASPFYGSSPYRGGSYYRGSPYRSSRGLGYYPNDPDDRNNPRHPNYIGPAGSRSSRFAPRYYANDPDDRNNPSHPNYIGPPGSYPRSRSFNPGHSYHPNDPDDRNNPRHPNYIGPPLN